MLLVALLTGCGGPAGEPIQLVVPAGASFTSVVDTLQSRGVIGSPLRFTMYARLTGADHEIRSGRYEFRAGERFGTVLAVLTEGRVLTEALTVPEGYRLDQIAGRIASISGRDSASVAGLLAGVDVAQGWSLPGPTLEGYLFPDTYRFAPGIAVEDVLDAMVERYRTIWTPERLQRRTELQMNEVEAVTLASIIQAEARHFDEMPRIASVYHNRLRRGMLLQADPTVIYALGGYRERLLFAAIDSVADSPYNTYTQRGLPPGPIGAPGEAAIDAALWPAEEPYLYFVARPDGTHIFTRSLTEHNRARRDARNEWEAAERRARARADSVVR
jgi:UPF0755 protein